MEEKTKIKDQEKKEIKSTAVQYYEAVGRRKEATARTRLYVAKDGGVTVGGVQIARGSIAVNGRPVEQYFPGEVYKKIYMEPFRTTNTIGRFAVSVKVTGGGLSGQLSAVMHSVARALEKVDKEKYRPILKKRGFLTRDARIKERRKAGLAHKARAKKQSPKR